MGKRKFQANIKQMFKKAKASTTPKRKSVAQVVKNILAKREEIKEFSVRVPSTVCPPVGGLSICLNQVAEGDSVGSRQGRQITPKGIYVDILIQGPTSTTVATTDWMQVALVWDKQSNSSTATFNSVFDTGVTSPACSFMNTATNRERFDILWAEFTMVQNMPQLASNLVGNGENTKYRKYFSFKDIDKYRVRYAGSAGTTPETGSLLLLAGTYNNTGTFSSSASIAYNCKFTFTDD